ncbi:hypothetical protein WDV06_27100 [Streptomyces racemochromogenes]|uniref:Uncharacterized protein n=1 Tax=Streptomyces racemochromogenes TaxID=67353 RepID=A0ABW7PK04_9ACTN
MPLMVVSSEVYICVADSRLEIMAWTGAETPTEVETPAENDWAQPEW